MKFLFLLLFCGLFSINLQGADFMMGVFDLGEVMHIDKVSEINSEIQHKQFLINQSIKERVAQLEQDKDLLKSQASILSKDKLQEKVNALKVLENEIQRDFKMKMDNLEHIVKQVHDDILSAIDRILAKMAKEGNFDIIIPKPVMQPVYIKSTMNLTSKVKLKLSNALNVEDMLLVINKLKVE